MNHCGIQQKNTLASFCEEMRNVVSISLSFDKGEHMVCPKPRRLSLFDIPMNEPVKPLRWHMCYQPEPYESKAGLELLEIIFEQGRSYGVADKGQTQDASSPSFFDGSPPSRVSNPLTQDTRFRDDKTSPVSTHSMIPIPASGMSNPSTLDPRFGNDKTSGHSVIPNPASGMSSQSTRSSSERKTSPVCGNFGNKPAVRIEGFDCRARDEHNNRNCSILALA